MSRWRSQVARRAGWGVADQALSSLTNFAVGVFVARELGAAQFGAFSLAFATYLVALNAARGLATDPLVVRFSDASTIAWRRAAAAATATGLSTGAVIGVACLLAGLLLKSAGGAAFLALGAMLPLLMLQDAWRYAFFAAKRGRDAFLNDLAWAFFLVPFIAVATTVAQPRVQWFIIAWGAAAAAAGIIGVAQARVLPRPSLVTAWVRTHHDLGIRYVTENISFSVASQLRLYGLGAISGLAAVGALRGAELLLGPVNLIIMGIGGLMAVPEAARLVQHDTRRFRSFIAMLGVVLAAAGLLWGAVLYTLLPASLGRQLLGATWESAAELLVPITLMMAFFGVWASAWTGIRAMAAARRGLQAQIIGASAFLAGGLLGAVFDGAAGAAWGSALGNMVAASFWWWQFLRALGELEPAVEAAASTGALRRST